MKFFNVKTFDEAKNIITEALPVTITESVLTPLSDCLNLTVAEDIVAQEDLPPYNRSTVDGFAVRATDVYGASESVPSILKEIGKIAMGTLPNKGISYDQCMEIATGAVLPTGANAVVMVEHTEKLGSDIAIYQPVKVRENVVLKGDDVAKGEAILTRGQVLTPMRLGVLAGLGMSKISVFRRPKIAIISTGDELVGINEKADNGKIRDINTTVLSKLCKQSGYIVTQKLLVKDNQEDLKKAVLDAIKQAEIVLISGGSSVGSRDFTEEILETLGEIIIKGVALKPGKPTMVAKIQGSLVFGLPGHPLAAALTYKTLVEDSIRKVRSEAKKRVCYAIADGNFPSMAGRTNLQPVTLLEYDGEIFARPVFVKSAHIAMAAKADGYVILSDNCEGINKGERVEVFPL